MLRIVIASLLLFVVPRELASQAFGILHIRKEVNITSGRDACRRCLFR